jgi:mannose-6-phosphate isomerase-like protein (cupin superfamily)
MGCKAQMAERIVDGDLLLAIIVPGNYYRNGIEFFTPENFSQQLAFMCRPAGYKISPHVHNEVRREVFYTQEVLFVRKGKVRVDFYDSSQNYLESRVLVAGDTVLLAAGGHGFEVLEEAEMIEVKQGPYAGDKDKSFFDPVGHRVLAPVGKE